MIKKITYLSCCFFFSFLFAHEPYSFWEVEVKKYPIYSYPYGYLAAQLKREGKESLTLFSYGSLLNYDSAKRTITEKSLQTGALALAFGVKRLFDRDVAIQDSSHWGEPCSPRARGMLNLFITGQQYDMVNGMTLTIALSEIHAICEREEGYNLVPVICAKWQESIEQCEADYYIAYTFSAPTESSYTSATILPRPGYYEMTRDAAKQFGLLYYYLWMKTTFMGDGKRSITNWERAVQEGKNDTLVYYPEATLLAE